MKEKKRDDSRSKELTDSSMQSDGFDKGKAEEGRRSFIPDCYRFSRPQPRVTKHSLPRSSSKVRGSADL